MNLQSIVQTLFPDGRMPESRVWVAYSGGLDSTVLLHLLKSANLPLQLSAVHVNHQISTNANDWQARCEAFCTEHNIPLHTEKVDVVRQGYGLEDAARVARYRVFASVMAAGDLLLTAHHADDQAETLLLRLLRGTGVRGLSAIAAEKEFAQGKMIRPLLNVTRVQLEDYARLHQLQWVDDESNFSDIYDRNYLRLHLLPLLQKRWPGFQKKWQETAKICADTRDVLDEFAAIDLQSVACRPERLGQSIDRELLVKLSISRQKNLIIYWLAQQGHQLPEQQHWQQFFMQVFTAREDANINLHWGNVSLRVYQNRIYALPMEWPQLILHQIHRQANKGDYLLRADLPNLHIKTRRGGERCQPAQRAHSQKLKKLLQEYQVEPWLRDLVPLVYSDENLVAVGDLWICAGYLAAEGNPGIELRWC
jgi:tRNA(Ile)-lysidine synthase